MLKRLRPGSAYDVIAVLALFIAVGTGGAYAANTIGSCDVIDESLLSQDLKNGEVKNADIGGNQVTTTKIKAGNVFNSDLAPDAVTGAKVLDDSLTGDDVRVEPGRGSPGRHAGRLRLDVLRAGRRHGQQLRAARRPRLDGLLGATAKAADADQLDGRDSKGYARLGGLINGDGTVSQGTGFTVSHPSDGEYQVSFPSGTLGTFCPPVVTATAFSGIVRHPQLVGRGCNGSGGGNFTMRMLDNDGVAHDTPFVFIAM